MGTDYRYDIKEQIHHDSLYCAQSRGKFSKCFMYMWLMIGDTKIPIDLPPLFAQKLVPNCKCVFNRKPSRISKLLLFARQTVPQKCHHYGVYC
jgi:hypothetical protein